MTNFDQFLTDRIGFGFYQYRTLFIVGMGQFLNGFSEYYQLQILEVLRTQKFAGQQSLEYLSSAQFLGMTAGYLIQSVIFELIGRRQTFIASSFLFGLGMIAHGAADTLFEMIIIRIILGLLFAMIDTSGCPVVCEIVPSQIRGMVLSALSFSFIFGVFFNGIGCLIFWDSIDSGNWRLLFYIAGTMSIALSFLSIGLLRESPRYLFSKQDYESGLNELNLMGFVNKSDLYVPVTKDEEKDFKVQFQPTSCHQPNFLNLFDPDVKRSTIVLWTLLILQNIMDKGFIVLIPFISKDTKQTLSNLPIFNSLEFLSPIVCLLIVDRKSFGRRRGLKLGYILCFGAFIIMYQFKDQSVLACITLQRFAQRLTWTFLNILAMESYSTRMRTLGYGISNCVGKCAGTIAPFIFIPLYFYRIYLPFLFLALITLINFIVVDLLPSELTQQPLDGCVKDELIGAEQQAKISPMVAGDVEMNVKYPVSQEVHDQNVGSL